MTVWILSLFAVLWAVALLWHAGFFRGRAQVQEEVATTTPRQRAANLARQEHDELSPDFLEWMQEIGDLGHPDDCRFCCLRIYNGGLSDREGSRAYESAIDCPHCGEQVRSAGLVEKVYAEHLATKHGLPRLLKEIEMHGLKNVRSQRNQEYPPKGATRRLCHPDTTREATR